MVTAESGDFHNERRAAQTAIFLGDTRVSCVQAGQFGRNPLLFRRSALYGSGTGGIKFAELGGIGRDSRGSLAFVAAFNQKNAKAVAALWTPDGEYTDDAGRRFQGREAIEKGYAKHFAENPNVKLRVTIDSLRLLSDSAAMEDGRAFAEPHTSALQESANTRSST